jgi:hypothetical protein
VRLVFVWGEEGEEVERWRGCVGLRLEFEARGGGLRVVVLWFLPVDCRRLDVQLEGIVERCPYAGRGRAKFLRTRPVRGGQDGARSQTSWILCHTRILGYPRRYLCIPGCTCSITLVPQACRAPTGHSGT